MIESQLTKLWNAVTLAFQKMSFFARLIVRNILVLKESNLVVPGILSGVKSDSGDDFLSEL
jgi:hypothetical protein